MVTESLHGSLADTKLSEKSQERTPGTTTGIIQEENHLHTQDPSTESKFMKLFSKCQCYLEDTPSLNTTLDHNAAPFVTKSQSDHTSTPFLIPAAPVLMPMSLMRTEAMPSSSMGPVVSSTLLTPVTLILDHPPPQPLALPLSPPTFPAIAQFPAVFQMPYHQPIDSPPLCDLACPFLPTLGTTIQHPGLTYPRPGQMFVPSLPQPTLDPVFMHSGLDFVYPGHVLPPSPALVTSPVIPLLSRECSPEPSISLPSTPVASPDPLLGYPTFVPRCQGPVYNTLPYYTPYVSYSVPYYHPCVPTCDPMFCFGEYPGPSCGFVAY